MPNFLISLSLFLKIGAHLSSGLVLVLVSQHFFHGWAMFFIEVPLLSFKLNYVIQHFINCMHYISGGWKSKGESRLWCPITLIHFVCYSPLAWSLMLIYLDACSSISRNKMLQLESRSLFMLLLVIVCPFICFSFFPSYMQCIRPISQLVYS